MNKIANHRKYYKVVAEALEHCSMSAKIKEVSRNTTLDFEISGIAQYLDENNTETKLSELISKYLNLSFDSKFKPNEFIDAAQTILKEYNE